jgi:transposase
MSLCAALSAVPWNPNGRLEPLGDSPLQTWRHPALAPSLICGVKCWTSTGRLGTVGCEEVSSLGQAARRRALEAAGLLHPRPEAVTAPLFDGSRSFFLAADKVQVKYELLRAVVVDGATVRAAAAAHGYSRAAYYLVVAAFEEQGMVGLLDERRGRRGPTKVTPQIADFLATAEVGRSGAELAREVDERFGVRLHRRTVERARRR